MLVRMRFPERVVITRPGGFEYSFLLSSSGTGHVVLNAPTLLPTQGITAGKYFIHNYHLTTHDQRHTHTLK